MERIDPSKVKWDDAPPQADNRSQIKWDDPAPAPQAEGAAPEDVGYGRKAVNMFKRGALNTLALAGGGPYDLAAGALEMLGIGPFPSMRQDIIRRFGPMFTVRPDQHASGSYAPKGLLEEYTLPAFEMAGAGAPFSLGTIARAAQPGAAALSELGSVIGGSVGLKLGGDVAEAVAGPEGRSTGEMVGALGGGIAGLGSPAAFNKIWATVRPNLSQASSEASVKAIAGKTLGGAINANPQAAANMQQADDVSAALRQKGAGEFRPTIGQATDAEGVQSLEAQLARSTPEDLGQYAQRQRENVDVINRARSIDFPEGGDFVRQAGNVQRATVKQLETRLDRVTKEMERVASGVQGGAQQAAGERLRQLRDQAQNAARAVKTAKISDVYATADRLGVSENMDDVVALVRRIGGDDPNTFQQMPPVFRQVIEEFGEKQVTGRSIPPDLMDAAGLSGGKPASFEKLHSLWRETNSQYATAERIGDQNAMYYLTQLKNSLRQKLAKYEGGDYQELADKFKDFNQWFSTKYAPAFYEGVGGRMSATSRFGDQVKPEAVVGRFFSPSGIDDFNLIYAGNREAQDALKDGVLGMFAESAIKDGRIDQRAAASFMRRNAETLDKIPDIRAALTDANARNAALAERGARLSAAVKAQDNSIVAQIAKTEDPAAFVQGALSNRRELMALVQSARTPEARRGVLRAIADNVPAAAARAGVDPLKFVEQNADTLRPVLNRLGPQHYDNLKILANADTILGRTQVPTHAVTPRMQDGLENITGSSPRTVWAQTANAAAGRQSHVSAFLHLFTRFGIRLTEKQTNAVLKEVIYNPELARDLVRSAGKPFSVGESNKLANHLANAGIRAAAAGQEQPE